MQSELIAHLASSVLQPICFIVAVILTISIPFLVVSTNSAAYAENAKPKERGKAFRIVYALLAVMLLAWIGVVSL